MQRSRISQQGTATPTEAVLAAVGEVRPSIVITDAHDCLLACDAPELEELLVVPLTIAGIAAACQHVTGQTSVADTIILITGAGASLAQAATSHLKRTGRTCRAIFLNASGRATTARRSVQHCTAAAATTWGTRM
eukprot:6937648-Prorocentrum_lima.AAC.1